MTDKNNKGNEKIVKMYASTPKEFEESLIALKHKHIRGQLFISLSICDPRILICPFHFTDTPAIKVKSHILSEAIEILSVPAYDLFVGHQVFEEKENEVKGIYACCKKATIGEYRSIAYKHKVILIKVTEYFLGLINSLKHNNIDFTQSIAILDLGRPGCINLGVIQNNSCEFLRKLPFETPEEAKLEITRSLKFASTQNSNKDFDAIYFIGPKAIHKELIESLEKVFSTSIETLESPEQDHVEVGQEDYFDINLISDQTLSVTNRRTVSLAVKAALAVCIFLFGFNITQIVKLNKEIKSIESSYTDADVKHAQELLKKSSNKP